ncbi:NUDIX domain-containing protein [Streptomyces sp. NPDC059850]|uniref:NUDIX hydrolase n=1 Tax=Streptomyces sp. NPDC059850 TaxID=3346970 RepID=UPI0036514DA8
MTHVPRTFPVSVKGVAIGGDGRVLLLRNERDEWELPGGRLELGETPEQCVSREIKEESGWSADAQALLDVWVYQPIPDRHVLIVTFGCRVLNPDVVPVMSDEHKEIGLFTADEVPGLRMPDGYKASVAAWYQQHTGL